MQAAQHLWSRRCSLPKTIGLIVAFCVAMAIASPAQTLNPLVSFTGTSGIDPGANPQSTLVQGVDGNFYGTTRGGGANNGGTVFKIPPVVGGPVTPLYNFCSLSNCSDGAAPWAGLVQGADGNFYGTTSAGGTNNDGTVFKITSAGTLTTLYSFAGTDGSTPKGALVQASNGNFYGTTSLGGANSLGTVFQITPGGTLTTLYSFAGPDGASPGTGLIQANDGNFYGTTKSGGTNNDGTIFQITPGGALTTLHSFAGPDGQTPGAPLIQAIDGNLYGTTRSGGTNSDGTVFRISLGGGLTTLYSFSGIGNDGNQPRASLVQATDGNFYGTTELGGSGNVGTIFEVTPAGTLTTLHNFNGTGDGAEPGAGLVEGTDGNLYGTTYAGGANGDGTVFQLSGVLGLNPYIIIQPTSGAAGTPVTILGTNLSGATNVEFNGTPATILTNTSSEITTTVPTGATTGLVSVAVPGNTTHTYLDFQVTGPLQFVPVTPCRVLDTRPPHGSGPIPGGTAESFVITGTNNCIPANANAAAYSLNVTVVPSGRLGYLTIWPDGEIRSFVSTMNSTDGRIKANAAIVPAGNNAVSIYVTDTTDVILDIDGYFAAPPTGTDQFYPLAPCRIIDTRHGQYGGTLPANQESYYPLESINSNCAIPSTNGAPTAYSLNITVLPAPGGLGYLTVWPHGETRPTVSTLNDLTGTIVANAAIVPAGSNHETAFYPSGNNTDLLVDVNGYFAPAGGSGALSLYPVTPCRAFDSRKIPPGQPFQGQWPGGIGMTASSCAPPASAQAFVLNATVVPNGYMGFLTLWPGGTGLMPVVSTLNAIDGFITSNMAIVPSGVSPNQGYINAYTEALTQLILDISGYFAP